MRVLDSDGEEAAGVVLGGAEEASKSLVMYTLQQGRILLRHRHLAMGFAIDPGRWACKPVQATGGRLCSELNVWVS